MIYTGRFSAACAVTAGILWVICSALVVAMPQSMMQMTAHMLHMDISQVSWTMSGFGLLIGLLSWCIISAGAGFLLAVVYNQFSTTNDR